MGFLVWLLRTGTLYRPDVWEVWWAVKWLPLALLLGLPGALLGLLPERWVGALWPVYLAPVPHALGPLWWLPVAGLVPLFLWRPPKPLPWAHLAGFLMGIYMGLHLKLALDVVL